MIIAVLDKNTTPFEAAMSGEVRSNSCLAEGRRRHFRKFWAFARFVRRDVIMAMIIGSAKSDVFTSPSWRSWLCGKDL